MKLGHYDRDAEISISIGDYEMLKQRAGLGTEWIARDSQRVKAIREELDEFQMRSKLLEPHQYKASNRLRGRTLLKILLIMKEDWDAQSAPPAGKQD